MKRLGIISLVFGGASLAAAQGLDTPISSTPTVRSELARGGDAAFTCQLDNIGRFLKIEECISSTVKQNTQQQKINDAFRIGLYSTALFHWKAIGPLSGDLTDNPKAFINSATNMWRSELKRARSHLNISNKDICAAMQLKKCDDLYATLGNP